METKAFCYHAISLISSSMAAATHGLFQFHLPPPILHFTPKHTCLFGLLSSKFFSHLSGEQQRITTTPSNSSHGRGHDDHTNKYLHLLRNCDDMESLRKVLSLLIVNRLMERESLLGEIIRICFRFNNPGLSLSVYYTISRPTLDLQNLMLRRLSDHGFYRELLSFYTGLQGSGCHRSNHFTFPFVIKACAALPAPRAGEEVHCLILRAGFDRNVVVQTALLDMYAKTGRMEESRQMFDEIPQRDLVSWNALLSGYSSNGLDHKAFEVFRQIQASGLKPNASTFVSVIPVCTRLGAFEIGKSLHGFALKCGAFSNESLMPTLISLYAGSGDPSVSRRLFEMLPEIDVVAWNAMISTYAQSGKSNEAFEVFQQMHGANTMPTLISFVSILPSCGNLFSTFYGESVHACGIKHGFTNQISVATALISMYAKLGDLDAAQFLFHLMPEKNLLSWNSMVSGCILNGQWDMGLYTFRGMLLAGVVPDSVSMVSVLSACSKLEKYLHLGKSVHAFILRNGCDSNLNVMNALLAMYSDCGHFPISVKLFHQMSTRSLISWNTLISGCARIGDTEKSIALFNQMLKEDVKFDLVTMISILPILYHVEDLITGMSFHVQAIKIGYDSDTSLSNALISMYVNCGDLASGYLLFDCMLFKSVVSWNAVMTGFRDHKLFREVMVLFKQMQMDGEKPNSVTLLNVLPICGSHLQGKSIHGYAVRNFIAMETSLITSIMCMYSRLEKVNPCCLLFEMADKRNVVVWNTMMSVHVRSKHVKRTVTCFREMLEIEMVPDNVTILTFVSACAQLGGVDLAQCVTGYVIHSGFGRDTAVSNSLIDMHARCGSISTAKELFDSVEVKDSISWSTMINGYGLHGDGEAALALFSEMREAGMELDDIIFIGILSACSHAGLVEKGRMLFKSMTEEHHLVPRMEHYACMVDLFGRTGRLDEAYDLVKRLPLKRASSLLESLLGACSYHGNIEIGEEIARLLFEFDPDNSRPYVMLSNIYAAAGRWSDSGRLRCDMEMRGLLKDPGFSLVEVK